jgi:endonuclease/exonuclease/phosphatase family metal-dependent hydrolase
VRPRIGDVVVATLTVVVMVGAVVIAVVALGHGEPAPPLAGVLQSKSPTAQDHRAHAGSAPSEQHPSSSPGVTPSPGASPSAPTDSQTVCVPRHQQTRLNVVTFNIHSARAPDGSVHLGTIAHALSAWHPDVVLLQEVDRGRIWTGRVDMPTVLADRLGMTWAFGDNVRRSATNQYGTAILSRYPILNARNVSLPAPPGTQQRGLLHVTIDANGIPVSVYGTHLENGSRVARLKQIRAIAPILAADPRPEIFGGDLNSTPNSQVFAVARRVVSDTWQSVGIGPGWTHPAGAPHIRIDYLFYRGGSGVDVQPVRAEVLPPALSDHRAVRATYRVSTGHGDVCLPVLPRLPTTGRS